MVVQVTVLSQSCPTEPLRYRFDINNYRGSLVAALFESKQHPSKPYTVGRIAADDGYIAAMSDNGKCRKSCIVQISDL